MVAMPCSNISGSGGANIDSSERTIEKTVKKGGRRSNACNCRSSVIASPPVSGMVMERDATPRIGILHDLWTRTVRDISRRASHSGGRYGGARREDDGASGGGGDIARRPGH